MVLLVILPFMNCTDVCMLVHLSTCSVYTLRLRKESAILFMHVYIHVHLHCHHRYIVLASVRFFMYRSLQRLPSVDSSKIAIYGAVSNLNFEFVNELGHFV